MIENKATKKRILIIFLDDDGKEIRAYSDQVDYKEGFVVFNTEINKLSIPNFRVLKVKEELEKWKTLLLEQI